MMQRLAQTDLSHWFYSKRRKPLIIRGARQVGKSTLIRQFCQTNRLDLFECNLEERPLKSLEGPGFPVEDVLLEIELIHKKKINPEKSLIFLDEIQEQPKAINLLRYFYEKKSEIAVVSAGSLLEVVLRQEEIEIPVGRVDFYQLGPMTFKEFLMALDETELVQMLDSQSIPEFIHDALMEKVRTYFIVGGMPESVLTYQETKDFNSVSQIQYQLLETYRNDFFKYAKKTQIPKLTEVFDYVPTHLGKKVKYVEIARDFKSKDLQEAIQVLTNARIIAPVYFTQGKRIPLKSEMNSSIMKLYFLDIGLCSKINQISPEIYDHDKFSIYLKGELAEQFVFQHLYYGHGKFENPSIFYWLNEKKNSEAELDFMIEKNQKIIPIEVKAEHSNKLKSLIYFIHINSGSKLIETAVKISAAPYQNEQVMTKIFDGEAKKDVSFKLQNIPFYQVDQISNNTLK